jgi:hypothetical protein
MRQFIRKQLQFHRRKKRVVPVPSPSRKQARSAPQKRGQNDRVAPGSEKEIARENEKENARGNEKENEKGFGKRSVKKSVKKSAKKSVKKNEKKKEIERRETENSEKRIATKRRKRRRKRLARRLTVALTSPSLPVTVAKCPRVVDRSGPHLKSTTNRPVADPMAYPRAQRQKKERPAHANARVAEMGNCYFLKNSIAVNLFGR